MGGGLRAAVHRLRYLGFMAKPDLLGYPELAELLDTTVYTVRTYLAKARKHRKDGAPRPGDLPEPDATVGLSPLWKRSTVERWLRSRPGAGAGNRPNRAKRGAQAGAEAPAE